jgi:holo-[acyl-carrier protein] synthase
MKTKIGTDIIEIERIQESIDRFGDNFLKHIFNEEEIAYAKKNRFPTQHFAARFAAKEAIYKAIGDDVKLSWKDITIKNDKFGRPFCEIKNKKYKNKISISISHTKNYAVANAIITT